MKQKEDWGESRRAKLIEQAIKLEAIKKAQLEKEKKTIRRKLIPKMDQPR